MAKTTCLDDEDRKLLSETKQKLDETTKLMGELIVTGDEHSRELNEVIFIKQ